MVTAFVLANVEGSHVADIADRLRMLEGIAEVHLVAGEYDILAIVRVADNSSLSELITREIVHTAGVQRTKTLISMAGYTGQSAAGDGGLA
ncbi:MAG: Lrp/AsnC family transcriptional regulator [Verrucomicrobiota bacterium]